MDENTPYNGSLTREKFLINEARMVARLKQVDGLTNDEIVAKVYEENLFQYPSNTELKSLAKSCCKRIDALEDETLIALLYNGTYEQRCQINLYAMMRTYRIMWEFMLYVIAEKYLTKDYSLSKAEVNQFMDDLKQKDDRVAGWSDSTINRIRSTITNSIAATGLIENIKKGNLIPIYLDWEVEQGIRRNGDERILPAFNCLK